MKTYSIAYTVLSSLLFFSLTPPFWVYSRITGKYSKNFKERLGFIPENRVQKQPGIPHIWIHAVSLGEVRVAKAVIDALKDTLPICSIVLSTTTESGRQFAEKTFAGKIPIIYAPVDFTGSVRKSLLRVCPDIMVFLETEIWPEWLNQARRLGIKTVLINGRISLRSFSGYRKARFFFREVLENFDVMSMISEGDAARIVSMGADPQKTEVHGNAKYEGLAAAATPVAEANVRRVMNLNPQDRVLVAGSTRSYEEEIILDAYVQLKHQFTGLILVVAPRHIERTREICAMIQRRGLRCHLWTDLELGNETRTEKIVVVNTLGELINIYSIGTIVFSGGSLVPLGGQNPLEPAIWGKPVFFGPHMENFQDAKSLLEAAGAGLTVKDADDLAAQAKPFIENPEALVRLGEKAKKAMENTQGAATAHAAVIKRLLQFKDSE